jgi:hypothetical protein
MDSLSTPNPFHEPFATRRYNYSPSLDTDAIRLVFLKAVAIEGRKNNTLMREGRFIWCKNLEYEGRNIHGYRQISFTVDKGNKRFLAAENNILCLPAKTFVAHNRFFQKKEKTFIPFSTVFSYKNSLRIMRQKSGLSAPDFLNHIADQSPYKPGALVLPRVGYFYPHYGEGKEHNTPAAQYPCGIILGKSFENVQDNGREFYRVRFGGTTYERVHPVQMEIINEV